MLERYINVWHLIRCMEPKAVMVGTHLSCFTGIGGIDLAAEWAGFETVGQIEKADFPYRVLQKHWPSVPKWRDIQDVTNDSIRAAGIAQPPTILSGGFPCQPFSVAGQRKGAEDDRYLWPEMLRLVQELRPAWVVGENVAGFISMALDDVLADLVRAGYSGRAFVFPAAGVGAPHKRDRVFIVAHSDDATTSRQRRDSGQVLPLAESEGSDLCGQYVAHPSRELPHGIGRARRRRPEYPDGGSGASDSECINEDAWRSESGEVCRIRSASSGLCDGEPDVPDSHGERREERDPAPRSGEAGFPLWRADPFGGLWLSEPPVGRVADGIPSRVDRLRGLGNAVVPQQIYPIFKAIAEIERLKQ
jgi:DNA (cytosine-5)-methyltransferase 1